MQYRFAIITCLLFWTSTAALNAEDIFVNNMTGDDKFNGRATATGSAAAGAVRTIGRALEIAVIGDRIVIEKTDLPYRESITLQGLRHSGTRHVPFRIVSDGAILDGTQSIPVTAWDHVAGDVYRFQPDLKSHQQLYLGGKPADRVLAPGGDSLPQLEPLQWALHNGWIYFSAEPNEIPNRYSLSCCKHQTGITMYQVHQVVVAGLVIQGFQLDGINAHDGVTNAVIVRCKLRGNGRSGLSVGGASRVQLDQSLVGNNATAQVRTEGYADVFITNCRVLESEPHGPGMLRSGGRITVDGNLIR